MQKEIFKVCILSLGTKLIQECSCAVLLLSFLCQQFGQPGSFYVFQGPETKKSSMMHPISRLTF